MVGKRELNKKFRQGQRFKALRIARRVESKLLIKQGLPAEIEAPLESREPLGARLPCRNYPQEAERTNVELRGRFGNFLQTVQYFQWILSLIGSGYFPVRFQNIIGYIRNTAWNKSMQKSGSKFLFRLRLSHSFKGRQPSEVCPLAGTVLLCVSKKQSMTSIALRMSIRLCFPRTAGTH